MPPDSVTQHHQWSIIVKKRKTESESEQASNSNDQFARNRSDWRLH